jgi:hypothetical protein
MAEAVELTVVVVTIWLHWFIESDWRQRGMRHVWRQ